MVVLPCKGLNEQVEVVWHCVSFKTVHRQFRRFAQGSTGRFKLNNQHSLIHIAVGAFHQRVKKCNKISVS